MKDCKNCKMARVCFPKKRYIARDKYEKLKNPMGLNWKQCAADIHVALGRYRKQELKDATEAFSGLIDTYLQWEDAYEEDPNNTVASCMVDFIPAAITEFLDNIRKKYGQAGVEEIFTRWAWHCQEETLQRIREKEAEKPGSPFLS